MRIPVPEPIAAYTRALTGAGVPVFIVGGWVRNAALGLPAADLDLCGPMRCSAVLAALSGSDVEAAVKSERLGTLELRCAGVKAEYTSFRSESYAPGGAHRPERVAFDATLEQDARRRDFTVNALYLDPETGRVTDPTGGLADLDNRVLRATSPDPRDILRSDALRVLRLARLCCELGFSPAPETFEAARQSAPLLCDIPPERRRQEFERLLLCDAKYRLPGGDAARSVLRACRLLDSLGAWEWLVPELLRGRGVTQSARYHRYDVLEHGFRVCSETPPVLTLRLAGLLHDIGKPESLDRNGNFRAHDVLGAPLAAEALTALRFPNRLTGEVEALVAAHMYDLTGQAGDDALRAQFARWGRDMTRRMILLREADSRGAGVEAHCTAVRWRDTLACMEREGAPFSEAELAADGDALMAALGRGPGPWVGDAKARLLRHCAAHPKDNTRERLIRLAGQYAEQGR